MGPSLAELGFRSKRIYEVVVSTIGPDGTPNAAPMGVLVQPPRGLVIRPFKTSTTYRNLKENRCGVANVAADPEVFFKTTFKRAHGREGGPTMLFMRVRSVRAPALKHANAKIAFVVASVRDDDPNRADFMCTVREISAQRSFPNPYCRGDFATIECIIHATRVRELLARGQLDKAEKLIQLIKHYGMLVKRVSPNSKNIRIIGKLLAYIRMWRLQNARFR